MNLQTIRNLENIGANIVNQTTNGTAQLLIAERSHPEAEIDKVTNPRGCIIAGLYEMDHHGFSSALFKVTLATFKEISKP